MMHHKQKFGENLSRHTKNIVEMTYHEWMDAKHTDAHRWMPCKHIMPIAPPTGKKWRHKNSLEIKEFVYIFSMSF